MEVAAHLIVAELVTTACTHARATRVHMVARREADELALRVSDDGSGIRPDAGHAVGVHDRAPIGARARSARAGIAAAGGVGRRVRPHGLTVDST